MIDLQHNRTTLIFLVMMTLIMITITVYVYICDRESSTVYVLDITGTQKGLNINQIDPPITEGLSPDVWNRIAKNLGEAYRNHDALVLYHPQENLNYTASCLAFMMEGVTKPVIVTNDTVNEELIEFVSSLNVAEVLILTNGKLTNATRTINDEEYIPKLIPSHKNENPPTLMFLDPSRTVALIDAIPELDLDQLSKAKIDGVVIIEQEPASPKLLSVVKRMIKNDIVVVHISNHQNSRLDKSGSLNVNNMSPYSAYTKLLFLLSNVQDVELVKQVMMINLRLEFCD